MIILNLFYRYQRFFQVFGSFLIFITLGYFYTCGIIQPLIVHYMTNHSFSNPVNLGNTGWIFGAVLFGTGTSISLGGFIEKKIGPTLTIIIGGWLASLNVILMYVTLNTYLSVVIISYGLFAGLGIGIAYGVTLGTTIKWFPKREGVIFGIVNSGYGVSAAIFIAIQNAIMGINHVNKYGNIDLFPLSFLIIGFIYAFLQFCGAILLKKNSNIESETTEINSISCGPESITNVDLIVINSEIEPHRIIFVVDFWIIWIILFINSICNAIITALSHRYTQFIRGHEDGYDMLNSFLFVAFNFTGRIFWGFLIDKISFKTAICIINLTSAVFMGTLVTMPLIHNSAVTYIYELWVKIIIFCVSGNFPIFPYVCLKLFGIKNFITNYGMLYTACSFSGSTFSIILNYYFSTDADKSYYNNIFITGSILLLAGALLTIFYRGKPRIVY